ncbi:MAG: PAS domain-containing protein [Halanaerobiales bacterium]|nr:PAS domain-containing protein [Halanaerobiales bacterium]
MRKIRFDVDEEREIHPILENYIPVVKGMAETLGENGEIVLHDLSRPDSSLFVIAGDITGREVGAPSTNLVLRQYREKDEPEDLLNYSVDLPDGRMIKSSIIFIRDLEGEVIGCLGINYELTNMIMAKKSIEKFCNLDNNHNKRTELFTANINEMIDLLIEQAKGMIDRPVPYMSKEDKIKIIEYLNDKGAFVVQGAVEKIGEKLGVTRHTIYNYLKEIEAE